MRFRPLPAAPSRGATESQSQTTDEKVGLEEVSLPKFHGGATIWAAGSAIPDAPSPAPFKTPEQFGLLTDFRNPLPLLPRGLGPLPWRRGFPGPQNHPASPAAPGPLGWGVRRWTGQSFRLLSILLLSLLSMLTSTAL